MRYYYSEPVIVSVGRPSSQALIDTLASKFGGDHHDKYSSNGDRTRMLPRVENDWRGEDRTF